MRALPLVLVIACSSPTTRKPFSDDLDLPQDKPATPNEDAGIETVKVTERARGPVKGKIAPEHGSYLAGEPIFVVFDATNTGTEPIEFDVGGDFGPALFPQRYTYVVRDDAGKVVCDLGRDRPPPQGGSGYRARMDPGKSFHETHTATQVCPALLQPGRYHLTISRVLTIGMNKCDDISPPDTTTLAASAKDPHGRRDAACMTALASLPAISTDSTIEIKRWDASRLRDKLALTATERPAEADRQGAIAAYAQWYCERVRCGCSDDVRYERVDDWLEQALSVVPDVPVKCP